MLGVAQRGRDALGGLLDVATVDLLDAAGVLHDIGYASPLVETTARPAVSIPAGACGAQPFDERRCYVGHLR